MARRRGSRRELNSCLLPVRLVGYIDDDTISKAIKTGRRPWPRYWKVQIGHKIVGTVPLPYEVGESEDVRECLKEAGVPMGVGYAVDGGFRKRRKAQRRKRQQRHARLMRAMKDSC